MYAVSIIASKITIITINNCVYLGLDGSNIPFYTCIHYDNRFFDYIKARDDELINIRKQHILLERCNCIRFFGKIIYCCSQCYNDLHKCIHLNSNKFS